MIKSIQVENFKALDNVSIPFSPFTVFIGDNSAGKTTILQLITFLKYCCDSSYSAFLGDRHLSAADICSKFGLKKTISIKTEMILDGLPYIWSFSIVRYKDGFALSNEKLVVDDRTVLYYSNGNPRSYRLNSETGEHDQIMMGVFGFSIIQLTDEKKQAAIYPELLKVKSFFQNVEALDLLSPYNMKGGNQKVSTEIGRGGEKLSAFVKSLSLDKRKKLASDVKKFVEPFASIDLKTKSYGWTYLEAKEKYGASTVSISSGNISDGILRIVAFCALQFLNNEGGAILLDEIEDGINNEHLKMLVDLLKRIQQEKNVQIIATTHSTVLLDYWRESNEEDTDSSIIYIGRTQSGGVIAVDLFAFDSIKEKLDYMFPGEIILNMTNRDIQKIATARDGQ